MNGIAIYIEGGGDAVQQRAEIREGIDTLLGAQKDAARRKRLRWRTVPSGGRQQTYEAFINEISNSAPGLLCVLIVDSEGPVPPEDKDDQAANAQIRKRHLVSRDGWNLDDVNAEQIHLMVQCMETWIVADPEALAGYYGKGFRIASLPVRNNLEDEPKGDIYRKLSNATLGTQKGEYAKIRHVKKLLQVIAPAKVEKRCQRFKTFSEWLTKQIEVA